MNAFHKLIGISINRCTDIVKVKDFDIIEDEVINILKISNEHGNDQLYYG